MSKHKDLERTIYFSYIYKQALFIQRQFRGKDTAEFETVIVKILDFSYVNNKSLVKIVPQFNYTVVEKMELIALLK